mgnify:CR=1 FL=1
MKTHSLLTSLIALAASPAFAAGHAAVSGYALADDGATLVVMSDVNAPGDVMTYSLASPLEAIAWRPVTGELLGFSDGMIAMIDPMSGEMTDLGALRLQAYLDSSGIVKDWAQGFVAGESTGTLSLLKDISNGVAARLTYEIREDEGTQTPEQTLTSNRGSCRDFAVLFVDAVRSLGFGARIVSGYLYDAGQTAIGSTGAGTTHAWAEVYVPGAGWITFDPTNRSVGGFNLVPVAVGRDIRQTMPVTGSFVGNSEAFKGMEVQVRVEPL